MNRQPRIKRQNEIQTRQKYMVSYQNFIGEEFNYSSHMLLKRICEGGSKEPNMYNVPLYKIMLEVAKIMMMNELQILFFGSTLQQMHWKITDPCLNDYVQEITDITPKLQKDSQSCKVQLSLLLIAYIVKIYLNEEYSLVDFKIRDIIKTNFDRMYQIWVQKVQNNFKFNPKNMNKLFKDFDNNKKIKKVNIVDYNKLIADFFKTNDGNTIEDKGEQHGENFYISRGHNDSCQLPIQQESFQNRRINVGPRIFRVQSGGDFYNGQKNDHRNQFIRGNSIDQSLK